jgi:hypothetical protein
MLENDTLERKFAVESRKRQLEKEEFFIDLACILAIPVIIWIALFTWNLRIK